MRKNISMLMTVILTLFVLIAYISTIEGAPRMLSMKGIGCWVQKNSMDNPFIYSDVFGWYVTDIANMETFENKKNKPLYISYAGKNPDVLINSMIKHKDKIVGALWDWEFKGTSQDVAESALKRAYAKAKELGISFGIVIQPGIKQNLNNGIDLTKADSFADFLMPMMYVQWFGMKRERIERHLINERQVTKLPIVAVMTIETTATKPPKKITPQEIIKIYKGLSVDGFCVWNVKDIDNEYIRALSTLK